MNSIRLLCSCLLGLVFLLSATSVFAHEDGRDGCLKSTTGKIYCSPPNGGIMMSSTHQIVCGPGQCIMDSVAKIVCSSQPGGYVSRNLAGQVVCTGGCEDAAQSKCQVPIKY